MARNLEEVLHYFLEEEPHSPEGPAAQRAGILAVSVPPGDLLRATLVWNLAVEVAGSGISTCLLVPGASDAHTLWPPADPGDLQRLEVAGSGPEELGRAAAEVAAKPGRRPALVWVPIPTGVLLEAGAEWIRWLLLLTTPRPRDLARSSELAARLLTRSPALRLGVLVHGVARIRQARAAFESLAATVEARTGRSVWSYGLAPEGLDLYRALAGRSHLSGLRPEGGAARALRDAARWIREDLLQGFGGA